jgi:hypothetical protein
MLLPVRFLEWNCFPRAKVLREMAEKPAMGDMNTCFWRSCIRVEQNSVCGDYGVLLHSEKQVKKKGSYFASFLS